MSTFHEVSEYKEDGLPNVGQEVLLYNPEWEDDFTPNGIRMGFLAEDGTWFMAKWCNDQDTYWGLTSADSDVDLEADPDDAALPPTHWAPIPDKP